MNIFLKSNYVEHCFVLKWLFRSKSKNVFINTIDSIWPQIVSKKAPLAQAYYKGRTKVPGLQKKQLERETGGEKPWMREREIKVKKHL
jgi:hypothetical protein